MIFFYPNFIDKEQFKKITNKDSWVCKILEDKNKLRQLNAKIAQQTYQDIIKHNLLNYEKNKKEEKDNIDKKNKEIYRINKEIDDYMKGYPKSSVQEVEKFSSYFGNKNLQQMQSEISKLINTDKTSSIGLTKGYVGKIIKKLITIPSSNVDDTKKLDDFIEHVYLAQCHVCEVNQRKIWLAKSQNDLKKSLKKLADFEQKKPSNITTWEEALKGLSKNLGFKNESDISNLIKQKYPNFSLTRFVKEDFFVEFIDDFSNEINKKIIQQNKEKLANQQKDFNEKAKKIPALRRVIDGYGTKKSITEDPQVKTYPGLEVSNVGGRMIQVSFGDNKIGAHIKDETLLSSQQGGGTTCCLTNRDKNLKVIIGNSDDARQMIAKIRSSKKCHSGYFPDDPGRTGTLQYPFCIYFDDKIKKDVLCVHRNYLSVDVKSTVENEIKTQKAKAKRHE